MTGITDSDSNAEATQRLLTLFEPMWGTWDEQWLYRSQSYDLGTSLGTLFIPFEQGVCGLIDGGNGGDGDGGDGDGGDEAGEECDPALFIGAGEREMILAEVRGYIDADPQADPSGALLPWMEGYATPGSRGAWRSYYRTGAIRRAQMLTNPPRWIPGTSDPSGWPGSDVANCAITESSQSELWNAVEEYFDEAWPADDS